MTMSIEEYDELAKKLCADGKGEEAVEVYKKMMVDIPEITSRANYRIGSIYQVGKGVPEDTGAALIYYELAEKDGLSIAAYSSGVTYQMMGNMREAYKKFSSISERNPSAAYWCYRLLSENKDLEQFDGQNLLYLETAVSLGSLWAMKSYIRRALAGKAGIHGVFRAAYFAVMMPYWVYRAVSRRDVMTYS